MKFSIIYWNYVVPIVSPLKEFETTFFITPNAQSSFFVVVPLSIPLSYLYLYQLPLRLILRDIVRVICHTNFFCDRFIFHKLRKQPPKYQYLGIAPLKDLHEL